VRIISASPPPDVVFARVSKLFQGLAILPPTERTLAIIKPDAVAAGRAAEITERIKAAGFVIVDSVTAQLSGERVDAFYSEHTGECSFSVTNSTSTTISSAAISSVCHVIAASSTLSTQVCVFCVIIDVSTTHCCY
jgi:hypothetical protein